MRIGSSAGILILSREYLILYVSPIFQLSPPFGESTFTEAEAAEHAFVVIIQSLQVGATEVGAHCEVRVSVISPVCPAGHADVLV